MKLKCEQCGGWTSEEFTHDVNGKCLCVLCSFGDALPKSFDYSKVKDARDEQDDGPTVKEIEDLIDEVMPDSDDDSDLSS